jgi:predicted DNA-binding protein (MmcQ/YjbR family)
MDVGTVRAICLALPHVTEHVQWGDNLVFKIGRAALGDGAKIFAIAGLEEANNFICFKCTPEDFAELVEREGIIPAPYLARAHWVSAQSADVLPLGDLKQRLEHSYEQIFSKFPRAKQALIQGEAPLSTGAARKKSAPRNKTIARKKK